MSDERVTFDLEVNGAWQQVTVAPRKTLADLLREDLGLTGTHLGCEHGVCGACTVLVDDKPIRSCLMFGVQLAGCRVETVEGLAPDDRRLSPIQEAFRAHHGLQCGFCTPGFLMLFEGLSRSVAEPTEEDLRDAVAANLCRCTGYQGIVDAFREASTKDREPRT